MRAMQYRSYGGPDQLQLAEVPAPTPGPGQVRVKVVASSVNPVDWKIASGKLRPLMSAKLPQIPGFDLAGDVDALGPGVDGFRIGQRVHARNVRGSGAVAELAVVPIGQLAALPDGMPYADAAALPLAGMTALQGLRDQGRMPLTGATGRICIVGASGGVGHLALQLARGAGAHVTAVCSTRNIGLVRSLGAQDVIDYTQADPWAKKAPFDLIYDCVQGSPGPYLDKLTPNGRYLSSVPDGGTFLSAALNPFRARKVHPIMLAANATDLALLDQLHARGQLRIVVDSTWPLEELPKAWERSMSGRASGKIVVTVAAA